MDGTISNFLTEGKTMQYKDKVVLVTGAASGIGLAIAEQFLVEGATVIGTDINEVALEQAASANSASFRTRVSDASDPAAIAKLAEWIEAEFGALDVLVNNAGFARLSNPEQLSLDDYHAQIGVLLTGPIFLVKHLAHLLRESSNGSVVNISSASAVIAMPGYCPYGTAKAAIAKFSEDCTITVPGVRHNAVLPGFIETPILRQTYGDEAIEGMLAFLEVNAPAQRVGTCADVASAVSFLASDAASYITGVQLLVDGGISKVHAISLPGAG
jgi:NAD(P)-dependent dehydrogenase (short-subunit alcohol dehydrogenase family)